MQHPVMLQLYMPGVVFIDKEGIIRSQYEGRDTFLEEGSVEKNIRAKIEEMLAPPGGVAMETVGGALVGDVTVTVIGADVVIAPRLSVARAVSA